MRAVCTSVAAVTSGAIHGGLVSARWTKLASVHARGIGKGAYWAGDAEGELGGWLMVAGRIKSASIRDPVVREVETASC